MITTRILLFVFLIGFSSNIYSQNNLPDRVYATFRFAHVGASAPLAPKTVRVSVNDGKPMNIDVEDNGTAGIYFDLPANKGIAGHARNDAASRKRNNLLEAVAFNYPFAKTTWDNRSVLTFRKP